MRDSDQPSNAELLRRITDLTRGVVGERDGDSRLGVDRALGVASRTSASQERTVNL